MISLNYLFKHILADNLWIRRDLGMKLLCLPVKIKKLKPIVIGRESCQLGPNGEYIQFSCLKTSVRKEAKNGIFSLSLLVLFFFLSCFRNFFNQLVENMNFIKKWIILVWLLERGFAQLLCYVENKVDGYLLGSYVDFGFFLFDLYTEPHSDLQLDSTFLSSTDSLMAPGQEVQSFRYFLLWHYDRFDFLWGLFSICALTFFSLVEFDSVFSLQHGMLEENLPIPISIWTIFFRTITRQIFTYLGTFLASLSFPLSILLIWWLLEHRIGSVHHALLWKFITNLSFPRKWISLFIGIGYHVYSVHCLNPPFHIF